MFDRKGRYNPKKHNIDSGGFNELSKAYKANPSIALYVKMRRKHPKALIEVATSYSMDWLLAYGDTLGQYGIDPHLVAGCLDATPEYIQELCLLLMENLIEREKLETAGEVHVQSRAEIMNDSLMNYLISMMLDALDWNDELYIPRDLIVLIKHQFGADISAEKRKYDVKNKKSDALWITAQLRAQGTNFSMRDVAKEMNVSPSTVVRWFPDGDFEEQVERIIQILDTPFPQDIFKKARNLQQESDKAE